MTELRTLLKNSRIMPVLKLNDKTEALGVAQALSLGGAKSLEVTLRTPNALEIITFLRLKFPDLCIGAGTILGKEDLVNAVDAGAQFIVSPGLTALLAETARILDVPFLPGVSSASEIMTGLEAGLDIFKFFPAETSGGVPALKALSGPFANACFCPTGGITPETAAGYLALANVLCIGGSWMVNEKLVREENWEEIKKLMADALEG